LPLLATFQPHENGAAVSVQRSEPLTKNSTRLTPTFVARGRFNGDGRSLGYR
jgi:hypothetical protein